MPDSDKVALFVLFWLALNAAVAYFIASGYHPH